MTVRTRVAPSPTGDPHLGTAYMALFNWAFAKNAGGEFIIRIEDTDKARSNSTSEGAILSALSWLGLDWHEGPDKGGAHGPYRQSERLDQYQIYIEQLLQAGHAFRCFCTSERLDTLRAEQRKRGETSRYDGHCMHLAEAAVQERLRAGESSVVRMKVPATGVCQFNDLLRGEIEIPFEQIDMQVLLKADGFPTYHFAVVVDDHLMDISHVLRGEEWINSVPKHELLYQYLGWQPPVWVHLPLLRNPDQTKLSKRKNPTSVSYYKEVGYLPEALLNYLGMMGWSMPDGEEIFSATQLADVFDPARISLGGPIFDVEKLNWLNGQYLRALDEDEFMDRLQAWAVNRDRLRALVPLVKERTEHFSDLIPKVDYLLGDRKPLLEEDFHLKGLEVEQQREILFLLGQNTDTLSSWTSEDLFALCQSQAEFLELKIRDYLKPVFVAISGRAVSLPLFDSMAYLGKDVVRMRLREALAVLGVSKKKTKVLDARLQAYRLWLETKDSEDSKD